MDAAPYSGTGGEVIMDFGGCFAGCRSRTREQNLTLMHQCQFVAGYLKNYLGSNISVEPSYNPEATYNISQVEKFEEVTRNVPVTTYRIGSGDNHYYFIKRTTFNNNRLYFNFNLKYAPQLILKVVEAYLESEYDIKELNEALTIIKKLIDETDNYLPEIFVDSSPTPIKAWAKKCGEHEFFNLQHNTKEEGNLYASFHLKFGPELIRRFAENYIVTGHNLNVLKEFHAHCMQLVNVKINGAASITSAEEST